MLHLYVFLQKKYVAKAKCKDEDAECISKLGGEEHVNMVKTNIGIKVEEEFLAVVKEIEGDNDDVPKEECSSACGKDRYEYEEGTEEVSGKK